MGNKDLYLSKEEYLDLLIRARENLDKIEKADGFDDNTIGDKDTQTNVGLCNDELTTKEIALFPKDFPQRKSMKYRAEGQKCPLDGRPTKGALGWGSGCFYKCLFFNKRERDLNLFKKLYDEEIKRRKELYEIKEERFYKNANHND